MEIYQSADFQLQMDHLDFQILLTGSFFELLAHDRFLSHNHFSYEVHFILSDCMELNLQNALHRIPAGGYCIIGPGVYHSYRFEKKTEIRRLIFRFNYKEVGAPAGEGEKIQQLLQKLTYFEGTDTFGGAGLLLAARKEFQEQKLGCQLTVQALFTQLLIRLFRPLTEPSAASASEPPPLYQQRTEIIEPFFGLHYGEAVYPGLLADQLHISVSQLNRVLKKLYGSSFKQKLLETRIEVAKDLLLTTGLHVSQIAERVGYEEASNFCCMFRRKTGVSPAQFRQEHRSK